MSPPLLTADHSQRQAADPSRASLSQPWTSEVPSSSARRRRPSTLPFATAPALAHPLARLPPHAPTHQKKVHAILDGHPSTLSFLFALHSTPPLPPAIPRTAPDPRRAPSPPSSRPLALAHVLLRTAVPCDSILLPSKDESPPARRQGVRDLHDLRRHGRRSKPPPEIDRTHPDCPDSHPSTHSFLLAST